MTDNLRTWLEERETIHEAVGTGDGTFKWMDDAYGAYPKLLAGVRAVLGVAGNLDREARGRTGELATEQRIIAQRIRKALQEAINDDE